MCAHCGFENEADDRFCGGCGQTLSSLDSDSATRAQTDDATDSHIERRELTILFADLSGYTRLTHELDSEDVHKIARRFTRTVDGIIEAYGGVVARHLGDAVMGIFGFPTAHSNDSERAVRATLAIHDAMAVMSEDLHRELSVHVGVASGRVLVDASQSDLAVTGHAVNLASRLYDLAARNETLIADATFRAAAGVARCEPYGELDIKGFPDKVRVHRLLGLIEQNAEQKPPIVGRSMELDQLNTVLRVCRKQRAGQLVYVRGDAGIGKTRLVEAFNEIALQQGYRCHRVLIFDFGMAINQDPVRLLVRSLLGIGNTMTAAQIHTIVQQQAEGRSDANMRQAQLFDLIGVEQSPAQRALLDAVDESTRIAMRQAVILDLVTDAAHKHALFIVVEDIHWAEQSLINQIVALAPVVKKCAAVLVVTSRIDGDPLGANISSTVPMLAMTLSALDSDACMDLAHQFIKDQEHIVKLCVERAGGNPLFLEQLLRSAGDTIEENLPGSVSSIVLSRMDKLTHDDRSALQAASVIGQRFDLDCLRYLIENARYNPQDLVRQALVRPDGDSYLFAHALVREGVYDSLLRNQRRGLHLRAAEWYSERDLALRATHLERGDADATRAYLIAARHALDQYRFESAVKLVDSGLASARNDDLKHDLFRLRGELCERLGEIAMCADDLNNALAYASSDEQRCQTHIQLASNLRVADNLEDAIDHLRLAEKLAVPNALYAELSDIHFQRGNIYFPMGKINECLAEHERARSLAHALDNANAEANALSGLGDANYQRGRMRTAFTHYEACLRLAEQRQLKRVDVANRHMRGLARYYLGELEASLDDCLQGANNAAEVGHQRAEMAARCSVGPILVDLGDYDGAVRESEHGFEVAKKLGAKRFEPLPLITIGWVAALQGDLDAALRRLRPAVEIAKHTGPTFTAPWALGCLIAVSPDQEECDAAIAEGERLLAQGSLAHCHLWFHRYVIDHALAQGRDDLVAQHVQALKDFTRRESLPWVNDTVARCAARS